MTSRPRAVNWLFTYGGWVVLAVLVTLWSLPVPRTVRLVASVAAIALCVCMHVALQRSRRADDGRAR